MMSAIGNLVDALAEVISSSKDMGRVLASNSEFRPSLPWFNNALGRAEEQLAAARKALEMETDA